MQANSLPLGKPKNTGVVAYPFSKGSSRLRNQTGVSCIAGGLYQLSYEGSRLGQPKLTGQGFPGSSVVKNPPANTRIHLPIQEIPWSRKWQATPVFLPGKFYAEEPGGQRSMGSQRVGHEHIHTRTPWPSLFWVLKLLYSSSQRVKGACDFFHLVGSETVGSCLRLIRHVDLIFPSNSVNSSLN